MHFNPRFLALILAISGLNGQVLAQIDLGTAAVYGMIASSAITNTGTTNVDGQIGISPADASSVTGFPPDRAIITGAVATQAKQDAQTAYDAARSIAPTRDLTGQDLGGQTLFAGIYFFSSSAGIAASTLTLDAQGDPNAQVVFQIGSTLTTASNTAVAIIDGARACKVFWQIGSSATLGSGTTFVGSILAQASVTLVTGASANGGLYALTAAITLDSNQISAPGQCPA
ncbi:hypothetical protein EK21DRAFT_73166 [Setomelanomma holmii]|uniref:DUF3494 domain-containing protein n=1 Tax=Setomelanomma holmii TaxID=210430 RepID=A0A9P4H4F8_9PLEO|nr:hypothetical protein EK21DRAFT_73166 [Setomelanomma holmii]